MPGISQTCAAEVQTCPIHANGARESSTQTLHVNVSTSTTDDIVYSDAGQTESVSSPTQANEESTNAAGDDQQLRLEDYQCPICLDPFLDAVEATCTHCFCGFCINQWFRIRGQQICPVCRSDIHRLDPKPEINTIVESLSQTQMEDAQRKERALVRRIRQADELCYAFGLLLQPIPSREEMIREGYGYVDPPHNIEGITVDPRSYHGNYQDHNYHQRTRTAPSVVNEEEREGVRRMEEGRQRRRQHRNSSSEEATAGESNPEDLDEEEEGSEEGDDVSNEGISNDFLAGDEPSEAQLRRRIDQLTRLTNEFEFHIDSARASLRRSVEAEQELQQHTSQLHYLYDEFRGLGIATSRDQERPAATFDPSGFFFRNTHIPRRNSRSRYNTAFPRLRAAFNFNANMVGQVNSVVNNLTDPPPFADEPVSVPSNSAAASQPFASLRNNNTRNRYATGTLLPHELPPNSSFEWVSPYYGNHSDLSQGIIYREPAPPNTATRALRFRPHMTLTQPTANEYDGFYNVSPTTTSVLESHSYFDQNNNISALYTSPQSQPVIDNGSQPNSFRRRSDSSMLGSNVMDRVRLEQEVQRHRLENILTYQVELERRLDQTMEAQAAIASQFRGQNAEPTVAPSNSRERQRREPFRNNRQQSSSTIRPNSAQSNHDAFRGIENSNETSGRPSQDIRDNNMVPHQTYASSQPETPSEQPSNFNQSRHLRCSRARNTLENVDPQNRYRRVRYDGRFLNPRVSNSRGRLLNSPALSTLAGWLRSSENSSYSTTDTQNQIESRSPANSVSVSDFNSSFDEGLLEYQLPLNTSYGSRLMGNQLQHEYSQFLQRLEHNQLQLQPSSSPTEIVIEQETMFEMDTANEIQNILDAHASSQNPVYYYDQQGPTTYNNEESSEESSSSNNGSGSDSLSTLSSSNSMITNCGSLTDVEVHSSQSNLISTGTAEATSGGNNNGTTEEDLDSIPATSISSFLQDIHLEVFDADGNDLFSLHSHGLHHHPHPNHHHQDYGHDHHHHGHHSH